MHSLELLLSHTQWIFPLFLLIPLVEATILRLNGEQKRSKTVIIVKLCTWLTFLTQLLASIFVLTHGAVMVNMVRFDRLSTIILCLISFISLIVQYFSIIYMQAEKNYNQYFYKLSLLIFSLFLFVASDNLFLLCASWILMSFTLSGLLQIQENFRPAKASSGLALKSFLIGDAAFILGVLCLNNQGITSLNQLCSEPFILSITSCLASLFFVIAALSKTANIPFYQWLPNTMASPTPVSAIMHAGFVNSGGYLLARLSPFYSHFPYTLELVFILGAFSAIVGTSAMLVQTDIKRYLAYSTMGQMGFMMAQCGLGAFPAAIFHLIAHSLFKSSLFLGSGSAIQKSLDTPSKLFQRRSSPHHKRLTLWLFPIFLLIGYYIMQYFSPFTGVSSILLIFPLFAMLQILINLPVCQNKTQILLLLGTGLSIPLLYLTFENGSHTLLGNAVRTIQILPSFTLIQYAEITLIALFIFIFTALWFIENRFITLIQPITNRLYVRLLNLSMPPSGNTIYTHRLETDPSRGAFYDKPLH